MKTLIVFRGAPGCGKSSLIEKTQINGVSLKHYALSPDTLRMMYSSPAGTVNGGTEIPQKNQSTVWSTFYKILENRMLHGEFTIVDATTSTRKEINSYKALADKYRYRMIIVDMTKIPIEVVKKQNAERLPEFKRVPESVIDKHYGRFETELVPSSILSITPEEFAACEVFSFKKYDFSKYNAIHCIGDIHGSADVLKEMLKDGLKEDEAYIFTGDFLDRGTQNAETLAYMMEIAEKENVYLIEGNHEIHLWNWANDFEIISPEFKDNTAKELEAANFSKKAVRKFLRKLIPCAYFDFHGKTIVVSHGGTSTIPTILTSGREIIHGTGHYPDTIDVENTFYKKYAKDNIYMVHGHRNTNRVPIQSNDCCFNLEGEVEFGGCLRMISFYRDGSIVPTEVENKNYKALDYGIYNKEMPETIPEALEALRSTKHIQEKKFGNISSFNFTREAFNTARWTVATVKARGLFINTQTNKIVARGYEKFFRIGERPETKREVLKDKLVFPVTAYVKENGYLGILGYDEETDALFVTSKGCPDSPHAQYFKEIFFKTVNPQTADRLKEYLKKHNFCMAFEVILPEQDPHIIEYSEPQIILLDIIRREIPFTTMPFTSLRGIADNFGLKCKQKAYSFFNWDEFESFCNEVESYDYKYNDEYIEGFVFEDATGYMTKIKSGYYSEWKFLRGVANCVTTYGGYSHKSKLISKLSQEFYKWILDHKVENPEDIIKLRKEFYKDNPGKIYE